MLIVLQFPLADVRNFVGEDTKRLPVPDWAEPFIDHDFVRSFGVIRKRRHGGLSGWVGEHELCIAVRGLSITSSPEALQFFKEYGWRLTFRTLYVDEYAALKYEIGVSRTTPIPSYLSVRRMLQAFLNLPVRVPSGKQDAPIKTRLAYAGKPLAMLYLRSTTAKDGRALAEANTWWVGAGAPALLIEGRTNECDAFGLDVQNVFPASRNGLKATNYALKYEGRTYSVWGYQTDASQGDELKQRSGARRMRIAIMRLHAEREALDYTLRQVRQGRLTEDLDSDEGKLIQEYMNEATRRLGKLERHSNVTAEALAGALEDEDKAPDAMDAFMGAIRPTLRRKLEHRMAGGAGAGTAPEAVLTGSQVGELQRILTDVFTWDQLTQFVRIELDEQLDVVAGRGPNLDDVVFRLIDWAEKKGRATELVTAAANARPRSAKLQEFAAAFGAQRSGA